MTYNVSASTQTSTVQFQGNTSGILPPIVVGASDGQRVSDKLSIKSHKFKLHICNYPDLAQSKARCVRIIIFSLKDQQMSATGQNLPSVDAGNFFRNLGSSTGVTGYFYNDSMYPVNTNRIIVHYDRRVYLGANCMPTVGSINECNAYPTAGTAKDFTFDLTKKCKIWKYDENGVNPNLPINHNLFCAVLVNYADGQLGSGAQNVQCYGYSHIKYKDA